jgi:hypothetical protein
VVAGPKFKRFLLALVAEIHVVQVVANIEILSEDLALIPFFWRVNI